MPPRRRSRPQRATPPDQSDRRAEPGRGRGTGARYLTGRPDRRFGKSTDRPSREDRQAARDHAVRGWARQHAGEVRKGIEGGEKLTREFGRPIVGEAVPEVLAPHTTALEQGTQDESLESMKFWDDASWLPKFFMEAQPGVGSESWFDKYGQSWVKDLFTGGVADFEAWGYGGEGKFWENAINSPVFQGTLNTFSTEEKTKQHLPLGLGDVEVGNLWKFPFQTINLTAKLAGQVLDVGFSAIERVIGTVAMTGSNIITGQPFDLVDSFNKAGYFYETYTSGVHLYDDARQRINFARHGPAGISAQEFLYEGEGENRGLKKRWDNDLQRWRSVDIPVNRDIVEALNAAFEKYPGQYRRIDAEMSEKFGAFWVQGQMGNLIASIFVDFNFIGVLGKMARTAGVRRAISADVTQFAKRVAGANYATEVVIGVTDDLAAVRAQRVNLAKQALGQLDPEAAAILEAAGEKLDDIKFGEIDQLGAGGAGAKLDADLARLKAAELKADAMHDAALIEMADINALPVMSPIVRRIVNKLGFADPVLGAMQDGAGYGRKTARQLIRRPWMLFDLTPGSRAKVLITNIMDGISVMMGRMDSIDYIMDFLKKADDGFDNLAELGPISGSVAGQSIRRGLEGFYVKAGAIYGRYLGAADEVRLLTEIAETLGVRHPGELVSELAKKGGPARVLRRLEDALKVSEEGTGASSLIRDRIGKMIAKQEINAEALEALGAMFSDLKIPFDIHSFRTIMKAHLADHVAALAIKEFGVATEGVFTKAAELVKATEALGFLRLSPTYPIRNFLNNEITMLARGVFGIMGPKAIRRFWERAGFSPERLGESLGPIGYDAKAAAKQLGPQMTASERGGRMITAVLKGDPNWMDKTSDFIKGITLGPFDMARHSQWLEGIASMRAYTAAYGKIWAAPSGWRVGGWIPKFTEHLDDMSYAGPKFSDEIVRALHGVAEDAMGAQELRRAFRKNNHFSMTAVIEETARRMGIDESVIRDVLPDEFIDGLKNDLIPAMEVADTDRVVRIMDTAHADIMQHIEDFQVREAAQIAEEIGARIEAGDIQQFFELWLRNQSSQTDAMQGHLMQMQHRVEMIMALPKEAQGAAWDKLMREGNVFWDGHMERYSQRMQGIVDAASRGGVAVPNEAIAPFRKLTEAHKEFYNLRNGALRAVRDGDMNMASARDMLDTAYQQLQNTTLIEGRALDDILYRVVDYAQPDMARGIRAARETVHKLRQRYMTATKNFFRDIDALDEAGRSAAYEKFQRERIRWNSLINTAERETANMAQTGQAFGSGSTVDAQIMDIFNRQFGGDLHAQQFTDAADEALKNGADAAHANAYAARVTQTTSAPVYSRMENYAGHGDRGVRAEWWDNSMQKANMALRDAENAGRDVSQFVPGAAEQIKDANIRMTWLEKLAMEAGSGTDLNKAALKELTQQWRSSTDFTHATNSPLLKNQWGALSAYIDDASPATNLVNTEHLLNDLRGMGYEVIPARGQFGGPPEASFLVPGLRDEDAFALGRKYGQESVITSSSKGLIETRGAVGNNVDITPFDFDTVRFGADIEDFYTEVTIAGKRVRFAFDPLEGAPARKWAVPLEGKGDLVTAYRFQRQATDVIDPHNTLTINGTRTAKGPGHRDLPDYHSRVYYYLDGTPAEQGIAAYPHRLEVSIPANKIYDLGEDPMFFFRMAGGQVNDAATWNKVEDMIRRAGYYGYRRTDGVSPNSVAIWEPLRHNAAPPVGADELAELSQSAMAGDLATSMSYGAGQARNVGVDIPRPSLAVGRITPVGTISPSGAAFGREIKRLVKREELLGMTDENVDAFINITEARARTWAIRNGSTPDDWYKRNIGGIRRGDAQMAMEFDAIHSQSFPTTDQFLEMMEAGGGVTPTQHVVNMLGDDKLPDHISDIIGWMGHRRAVTLKEGFKAKEVAEAYLMTIMTIGADAISVDKMQLRFGATWDEMTRLRNINDYSFLNKDGLRMIRPEDVASLWLHTPMGRRTVDMIEQTGEVFWPGINQLADLRGPFGLGNTVGMWGKKGFPQIRRIVDELNLLPRIDDATGEVILDTDEVRRIFTELQGVGEAKDAFMGHYFGFGDKVTLDARQMKLWVQGGTEPLSDAKWSLFEIGRGTKKGVNTSIRSFLPGTDDFVEQLSEKGSSPYFQRPAVRRYLTSAINDAVEDMYKKGVGGPGIPKEMYRHAIHHWLWEKMGQVEASGMHATYTDLFAQLNGDGRAFIRGAIDLRQSQAVIHAFGAADPSTLVHEIAHLFRREIASDVTMVHHLDALETFYKIKDGDWNQVIKKMSDGTELTAHEAFAKAFEVYLKEGNAPTTQLESTFKAFEDWLTNLYRGIRGQELDVPINDDIRAIFDDLLDYQNATPEAGGGYVNAPRLNPNQMDELLPQTTAPMAEGTAAHWYTDGGRMYDNLVQSTVDHMSEAPVKWDNLSPEQGAAIRAYEDKLIRRMPAAQLDANRLAQVHRDAAMLNYTRRTNFDHLAGHMFPFGFWTWNSMWNWMTYSNYKLQPNLLADYFRLTRLNQKFDRDENTPARFANSYKIPLGKLPFIPDWMGDVYVNPFRVGLPFESWSDPLRQQAQNEQQQQRNVEGILSQQVRDGTIDHSDMSSALNMRSGEIYEAAVSEAKTTRPQDHPIDTFSYLLAPHAPLMWAWHLFRGQKEKIGPFLPATRTIRGLTSIMGFEGGKGINPEAPLRAALGLPEGDRFDEYRVERMLNNMLGDGMISITQYNMALSEKGDNPNWQIAERRAAQEYAVTGLTATMGIPLRPFPTGEERMLALKQDLDSAYASKDPGKVREFFNEYPEVAARLALWDEPEERTNDFLVQQMWDQWHNLTTLEKRNISDVLGDEFGARFLDKETRLDAKDQDINDLVVWSRTMGLVAPKRVGGEETDQPGMPIQDIPQEHAQMAEAYYETKRTQYAYINEIQEGYFQIDDKKERRKYLEANPKLYAYWGWREDFLKKNPELIPYIVEDPSQPGSHKADTFQEQQEMAAAAAEPGPQLTWTEWRPILTPELWRLAQDEFRLGIPMDRSTYQQVEVIAGMLGMSPGDLVSDLEDAYGAELQGGSQ